MARRPFLYKPTSKKVFEVLKITYHSTVYQNKLYRIRAQFTSEEFKTFRSHFQKYHIACPVRDHRGNGKIERLI